MRMKSSWLKSLGLKCHLSRRLKDISTVDFSTPDFSTMNSLVQNSGVERSGVEMSFNPTGYVITN
jgi:hypothetical protein